MYSYHNHDVLMLFFWFSHVNIFNIRSLLCHVVIRALQQQQQQISLLFISCVRASTLPQNYNAKAHTLTMLIIFCLFFGHGVFVDCAHRSR